MKAFLTTALVLGVVLALQPANAFPRLRGRRESNELSLQAQRGRISMVDRLMITAANTRDGPVNTMKKLFTSVVKSANDNELKSEDLTAELQDFKDYINTANRLQVYSISKGQDVIDTIQLLSTGIDLIEYYDEIEDPTKEKELIKKLIEENGGEDLQTKINNDSKRILGDLVKHFQSYVDSLNDNDRKIEAELVAGIESLKAVVPEDTTDESSNSADDIIGKFLKLFG